MAVVAYRVFVDGELAATIPAPVTALSLDGFKIGSGHTVAVTAVDEAGNESSLSDVEEFTVLGLVEGAGVSDAFGRIVTRSMVEQAVIQTLQAWLPAYLDEVQRQALAVMPIGYPAILRAIEDPDHTAHPLLPMIEAAAELESVERYAESTTHLYRVGVYATIDAGTSESARLVIDAYTAAITVALDQHGSLGGLSDSTRMLDQAPEPMSEGSHVGSLVTFRVVVPAAARRYSHVTEPPGQGASPPADLPVTLINIDEQLVQ